MTRTDSLQDEEKSSNESESHNDDASKKESTGTGGSSSDSNDENCKNVIRAKLSKEETSTVNRTRLLVLFILVFAGTAISVIVFIISKNAESDQFRSQYDAIAEKVFGSFATLSSRLSAINSIGSAASVAGFNRTTNTTNWPFVTLPAFEQRAATALALTLAFELSMYPIVSPQNRDKWESYSVGPDKYWINDGLDHQADLGLTNFEPGAPPLDEVLMTNYSSMPIVDDEGNMSFVESSPSDPYYLPRWQTNPVLKKDRVNINLFTQQRIPPSEFQLTYKYIDTSNTTNASGYAEQCVSSRKAVLSSFDAVRAGSIHDSNPYTARMATIKSFSVRKEAQYLGSIQAMLYLPLFDTFNSTRKVVGVLTAAMPWRRYLEGIFPENVKGIIAVIENTCCGNFTFEINGNATVPLGFGDFHDPAYERYSRTTHFDDQSIVDGTNDGLLFDFSVCLYSLHVYPSDTLLNTYRSSTPLLLTFSVAMVFAFTIGTFLVYNYLVERRQTMILNKAAHSTAIVSSMFPKQVRDRLLEDEQDETKRKTGKYISGNRLQSYLVDKPNMKNSTQPIADLFPNATVMFADIAGFTAWSSTRGPESVFVLLQTIYEGFDKIAKRRHVFKVETIGDCYLAVTGVPNPQPKHALIMARFAWECRDKMTELVKGLDVQLGPDCSDLKMRFGIHSGPVTAGVLRGDRARFQLFWDAVNTAARMESTGTPNMIQLSQTTANLLTVQGKSHWLKQRDDIVVAKGKGTLVTFWLERCFSKNEYSSANSPAGPTPSNSVGEGTESKLNEVMIDSENMKRDRLVDWTVELLTEHLKKMTIKNQNKISNSKNGPPVLYIPSSETTCLDEFKEVIVMCKNDENTFSGTYTDNELDPTILCDLRSYISILAQMYRTNPFHNFEHACHVTLSVSKLLQRIVSPEISTEDIKLANGNGAALLQSCLHNYTYGIFSDSLAHFAIVFAAIIHDVDHRGCSNTRLIAEEPLLGVRYRNQSVAEQNSIDLAWNLLMSDQFQRFREYVFGTQTELLRFRQLLVNSVLATDIFDKDLNALRQARWKKAFSPPESSSIESPCDSNAADIKAPIVIEHIIQASDVSHTMQHWHVYLKWNKRLFHEMYLAFLNGRLSADPSKFWYQGELSFFDNYVIPLAKKLKECNVFGVSADEYLDYAASNRSEWELVGESIIEEMLSDFMKLFSSSQNETKEVGIEL